MFWTVFSNLCANANISPNAVATELKIPSGSITAWHNGAIPRTKSLTKIANYFDVTPDYLLHGDEQTKNPIAQGDGISVDYVEKWIDNAASEEDIKYLIAKASAKLLEK